MTTHDEVVCYLRMLIDHEEECQAEGCSVCTNLREIVSSISQKLFSTRIYSDMQLSTRRVNRLGAGMDVYSSDVYSPVALPQEETYRRLRSWSR